jgi:hypothetical protein
MNRLLYLILVLTGLAAIPLRGELQAQSDAEPLRGRAMGISMDRFRSGESALVAMTYRYSSLHPGGIGGELGVSVFPQALPAVILATAPDLGASYNMTVPGGSVRSRPEAAPWQHWGYKERCSFPVFTWGEHFSSRRQTCLAFVST